MITELCEIPNSSQKFNDNVVALKKGLKARTREKKARVHRGTCVLPSCMAVWQCAKGAGTGLGCRRWVESGGAQARDWQGSASRRELLVTKSLGAPWGWTMQVGQARPVEKQADAVVWAL